MPTDSSRIFISYHRQDTAADAGRLADVLEHEFGPEPVFLDVSGIEVGANWERVVDQTLEDTVSLVLVIGPSWVLTGPIARELRTAIQSGVAIIPVLVRGARWDTFAEALPPDLKSIEKLNARALDHDNWRAGIQPLVDLLKRMLNEPARARIACSPPESRAALECTFNKDSIRSMLVHAADLAECLGDDSILEQAKAMVTRNDSKQSQDQLIEFLGKARYRLLIEEIGRDLLSTDAVYVARYLQNQALESQISAARAQFDEAKRIWYETRGDGESPATCHQEVLDVEAKARDELRRQLPGITKHDETGQRLSKLVYDIVNETLSGDRIQNVWCYTVLRRFSQCSNIPYVIRDLAKAEKLLNSFESSQRDSRAF